MKSLLENFFKNGPLITTDIKAAFQEMCRQASFDTLTGKTTKPYDDGRVQPGHDIPTINELRAFLGYFTAMHSTASNNRYRDHRGHTLAGLVSPTT
jgi:hypothetical protein